MTNSDVADKKASLTHRPAKVKPVEYDEKPEAVAVSAQKSAPSENFVPRKRLDADTPVDGEEWDDRRVREAREATEADIVEARLSDTEQLGLDAGRCAEKVKALRRETLRLRRSAAKNAQELADAEALLAHRLNELRSVGQ